ncbi:hypothetical protein SB00610_03861 [Klebsiella quasipneumoniae subsp. similipneumoniae]|nr:hypothetical protein SB00610_03861 [Klebsiella quasipneumoniae subsp. similipneumoniae]
MQVEKGEILLELDDLTRQGAVEIGQHGDKVIERRRQHAKQRGEHHQHCRHHQGHLVHSPHPAANEPGDQRVEDDSEKQRQQELHQNIGGGVDPGEDNHQRRQLK